MNAIHDRRGPEPGVTPEELARYDLNLLVSFDALARTRSVTAAAELVGITQSAMSHALRRLRNLLDDPLLVRGRGGMVLTPRAEALVVPLRSGLNTLGRALSEPTGFEPQTARRAFCLATPDLFDILAIPRLLARTGHEAPGVDITLVSIDASRLADRLETGEIDAAVIPQVEEIRPEADQPPASGLVRRTLFRDRHVCLIRSDHPHSRAAARGKLSLATFAELSHMVVSPQGSGPGMVDRMLDQRGLSRRIALRIPHFYSALAILASCDFVLTAPTGLAQLAARDRTITSFEPPLRLPNHNVHLLWHERWTNDPGHRWLRKLLIEIGRQILS